MNTDFKIRFLIKMADFKKKINNKVLKHFTYVGNYSFPHPEAASFLDQTPCTDASRGNIFKPIFFCFNFGVVSF